MLKDLNIVFDNLIFSLQSAGGISTYWYELISRAIRDDLAYLCVDRKNTSIIADAIDIKGERSVNSGQRNLIIDRFFNLPLKDIDRKFIFHSSYNRITSNPHAVQVLTVHDFVHEQFYGGIRKLLHTYQKNKAISVADRIIAVSQNTKLDLLKFHPKISEDRIKVIYNGVSETFYSIEAKEHEHGNPYLVFIGSREPYKNFDFTVKMVREISGFNLCIVGTPLTKSEITFLNKYLKGRWSCFSGVSNVRLNTIYNNCYALLYPSSYEGFGIPLLEAMRAGTPFVALNRSSIPEVAGDAGILLDELDIDAFKNAVQSIESNRETLIKRGFLQAQKFSWETCYQETLKTYRDLEG